MGGLEGVFEGFHFVAVAASQLGELGGERPDHAAGVVGVGIHALNRGGLGGSADARRWRGVCRGCGGWPVR